MSLSDDESDRVSASQRKKKFSLQAFGRNIATIAAATGAIITDSQLRSRAAQTVASTTAEGLRQGLQGIQSGPRQLQSVLRRLQAQAEENRRRTLLEQQKDSPVDIQVGTQLFEDAPQELRTRLWMALLEHPQLSTWHSELLTEEIKSMPVVSPGPVIFAANLGAEENVSPEEDGSMNESDAEEQRDESSKDAEEWEVVPEPGPGKICQGMHLLSASRPQSYSSEREAFKNQLMAAMMAVPWPLSEECSPETRYATLLQISIGQEDVDDIILRDCHRTFPEHPMFGFHHGQKALFRVLKAYSLADLEVGYCQGMAFVAGLLLFYVEEEPAFQLLCRLLGSPQPGQKEPEDTINLRKLYLPGLEGLKLELWKLDYLLGIHLPNLKKHLETHAVVPVLYASQWLLTCFSCPFPVNMSCRLIDIMLLENSDAILLRCAMCILAECEAELLMQDDFEELLTYLKVAPLQWNHLRQRRVIDAALASPITNEELETAAHAAEAAQTNLDARTAEVERVNSRLRDEVDTEPASEAGDEIEKEEERDAALVASNHAQGDDLDAQLAAQRAALDQEMLNIVLELDDMWAQGDI